MQVGDFVKRKSYGGDIIFRICELYGNTAVLEGTIYRLIADAPIDDLELVDSYTEDFAVIRSTLETTVHWIEQNRKNLYQTFDHRDLEDEDLKESSYFEMPGKVLHLDGDKQYLEKCMKLYEKLRIPVDGYFIEESGMADVLGNVLPKSRPDIIVITGHDAILKHKRDEPYDLSSYKNSHHFIKAVTVAREYERNRDALTIVAGACQSHFEALLKAGANFASSPGRVMIHVFDPVQVASKAAYTSIRETVNTRDVLKHTVSGLKGMGGIETRGSYRIGLPNLQMYS